MGEMLESSCGKEAAGIPSAPAGGAGSGVLVLYDAAVGQLREGRVPQPVGPGVEQLYCVGFPTLHPDPKVLAMASEALGVPVLPWPTPLTAEEYRAVWERACDWSDSMQRRAPASTSGLDWARCKANDRVYYRIAPSLLLEALLESAFADGWPCALVVPWLTERYDLVERSGMLGFDAPAHQLVPLFRGIRERFRPVTCCLWPGGARRERIALPASRAAMSTARNSILFGRSLRDRLQPYPAGVPHADGDLPALGYVVQGASPWNSLRELTRASGGRYQSWVYAWDIFRNPTSFSTLRDAGVPFVPIDSMLSPAETLRRLASTYRERRRIARRLAAEVPSAASRARQENVLLAADAASLPELDLFYEQLRRAIRRHRLRAVFSANCVDAFLSATTEACRREGVPHICVQNVGFEFVRLPVFADSDLYLCESVQFKNFLEESRPYGPVEALGLPYYDELIRAAETGTVGPIVAQFPALRGKKIIGVATQTELIDFRPILEPLVAAAERRDDLAVVIKLHPREGAGAYRELGARLERAGRGAVVQHVSLTGFLAECDSLVSVVSSTIRWAIVMGARPFSWLDPNYVSFARSVDYMRPEVTTSSQIPEEVVAAVLGALDSPEEHSAWLERRRAFVDEFATGADGHACERIFARVQDLIAEA